MVEVIWQKRGICWKYSGPVSGEEIVNASTSIYADVRFGDLRYKLCDFIDAESISMTPREMTKVVCQHAAAAQSNPDIKIAIVGKKTDFPTLMLLVECFTNYESRSSWPIEIFEDLAAAQAWLAT